MTKAARRVRTGEKRKASQPLKIDRLPEAIKDKIVFLKNHVGKTWQQIEDLSAEPFDSNGNGGFIDWKHLPLALLELFPDMRLPHTNLHRWYDLRVLQVQQDVLVRSKQAQKIAEAFAKSTVADGDEAVINACRDTLMSVPSEDGTDAGRLNATKGLLKLSEVMSRARTNEIRQRKVAVDERRIAQLEKDAELRRKRMETETETVAKKMTRGELTIDDINKLRQRTFGLPPLPSTTDAAPQAV